jgi:hypothetical protein
MRKLILYALIVSACSVCQLHTSICEAASDPIQYLPDRVGDFLAQGPATTEKANQEGTEFQRTQRSYMSSVQTGAGKPILLCVIAIIDGDNLTKLIEKTFAKGKPTKIGNYDAVSISENNMSSTSVGMMSRRMLTAIVLNTSNVEVSAAVIKALDLNSLSANVLTDTHMVLYKGGGQCGGRQLEVSFMFDTVGATIKDFSQVHSCVKEINDGGGIISQQVNTPLYVKDNRFSSSLVTEGLIYPSGKASGKILGQMQTMTVQCSDGKFYQNCTDWNAEPEK